MQASWWSSVVTNPPANTENMGSVPGLSRSHAERGNQVHAPQLLSLLYLDTVLLAAREVTLTEV